MEDNTLVDQVPTEIPPEPTCEETPIVFRELTVEEMHNEILNRIKYAKLEFYRASHGGDKEMIMENIYRLKGAIFALSSMQGFLESKIPSVDEWPNPID
jgi:hypothetical protein